MCVTGSLRSRPGSSTWWSGPSVSSGRCCACPSALPHELPLRQGRAIGWLREALEPLSDKLGDAGLHQLALALRSVCGIETRVWLRDVAGLDPEPLRALQLWMVDALVERAEHDPPPHGVPLERRRGREPPASGPGLLVRRSTQLAVEARRPGSSGS